MIGSIKSNIKTVQYELRRLVCGEDEAHIVLQTGREIVQEVVPETLMYFKINVANKVAPGRLIISYGKN
jgi:hypothetical protein